MERKAGVGPLPELSDSAAVAATVLLELSVSAKSFSRSASKQAAVRPKTMT